MTKQDGSKRMNGEERESKKENAREMSCQITSGEGEREFHKYFPEKGA